MAHSDDRGVDDAEPLGTVELSPWVDHRSILGTHAHGAGSHHMGNGIAIGADEVPQVLVGAHIGHERSGTQAPDLRSSSDLQSPDVGLRKPIEVAPVAQARQLDGAGAPLDRRSAAERGPVNEV